MSGRLGLFTIMFSLWAVSVSANEVPKYISQPVFCEALMWAEASVPSGNPRVSLHEFRDLLSKERASSDELPGNSIYDPLIFNDDFNSTMPQALRRKMLGYVIARLDQLAADSNNLTFDKATVAFEFRGREQVAAARGQVVEEINHRNPQVMSELKKRFPALRFNECMRHAGAAFCSLFPLWTYLQPGFETVGAVLAPISIFTAFLLEHTLPTIKRKLHTVTGFTQQLKKIDDTLAMPMRSNPISVVSESFEIQTELHNSFMKAADQALSKRDVELMTDASEGMHFGYWDTKAANGAKYYPEGLRRFIQLDSIFYVDLETREPVWLVFYRAFKEKPRPPGKPRKEDVPAANEASVEYPAGLRPSRVYIHR